MGDDLYYERQRRKLERAKSRDNNMEMVYGGAFRSAVALIGKLAMLVLVLVLVLVLGVGLLLGMLGAVVWLTGVIVAREELRGRAWSPLRSLIDGARSIIKGDF
jgi:ABC-type protease/lipase transport system fused ATPase/permease subunit